MTLETDSWKLLAGPFDLGSEDISVQVSPVSYTLATLDQNSLDREVRQSIKKRWVAAHSANPRIFPGLKFRLTEHPKTANGVDNLASRLTLLLSMHVTDYGIFVATNSAARQDASFVDYLKAKGREFFHNDGAYFGNPVGNVAAVESSDNRIVLIKRPDDVHQYPGWYDTPGGHAEPGEHTYDAEGQFQAMVDELTEETTVPSGAVEEARLMGVMADNKNFGKPDLLFQLRVDVPSSEIQLNREVAALETLARDELFDRLKEGRMQLVPASQGLFAAYFSLQEGYDVTELFGLRTNS